MWVTSITESTRVESTTDHKSNGEFIELSWPSTSSKYSSMLILYSLSLMSTVESTTDYESSGELSESSTSARSLNILDSLRALPTSNLGTIDMIEKIMGGIFEKCRIKQVW